jgi:hypothetical protein
MLRQTVHKQYSESHYENRVEIRKPLLTLPLHQSSLNVFSETLAQKQAQRISSLFATCFSDSIAVF